MIRHLLRIVWNRRRANALVALEILLSFLVLCAVATMFVYYVDNYRRPLGYVWQDTWVVTMDANARDPVMADAGTAAAGTGPRALQRAMVARLIAIAGDLPEVTSASAAFTGPYDNSTWRDSIKVGGKQYVYGYNEATDGFADTLRTNVLRGRWFDRSDDGADWTAAVINLRLAREMFGDGDPVGQLVEDETEPDPASPVQHERTRLRIVGVIDDFRKDGEYSAPGSFLIARNRLDDPRELIHPPRVLLVRVRPGTTAAFEEKLVSRLRAAAGTEARRVAPQLHRPARGGRRRRGLPVDHGRARPHRRAVAERDPTHQRNRPAPREGRNGAEDPAAARRRGDCADDPGRARGSGGCGPVPAVRAVR